MGELWYHHRELSLLLLLTAGMIFSWVHCDFQEESNCLWSLNKFLSIVCVIFFFSTVSFIHLLSSMYSVPFWNCVLQQFSLHYLHWMNFFLNSLLGVCLGDDFHSNQVTNKCKYGSFKLYSIVSALKFCFVFVSISRRKRQRSKSPEPSCVSLRSNRSKTPPPAFSDNPL